MGKRDRERASGLDKEIERGVKTEKVERERETDRHRERKRERLVREETGY